MTLERANEILDAAFALVDASQAAQDFIYAQLPENAQRLVGRLPAPHNTLALRSYGRQLLQKQTHPNFETETDGQAAAANMYLDAADNGKAPDKNVIAFRQRRIIERLDHHSHPAPD